MNFSNIKSIEIPQGVVKQITTSQGVVLWKAVTENEYSRKYLTLVAKDSGTFVFKSENSNTISYSTDNGITWSTPEGNVTVNVNIDDKVLWKGEMNSNNSGCGNFTSSTAKFDIEGNIMSLIYDDNFRGKTSFRNDSNLNNLFKNTKCEHAHNLILPATTMQNGNYSSMFQGCTFLTTPPELPATTLAGSSYTNMFNACSSLLTAPELPATTLTAFCYQYMFYGCSALTTAPEIPAITTQGSSCCEGMFQNCTSLTKAPTKLPATTLSATCYATMFGNCQSLTSAPELPATTLANTAYTNMFRFNNNINYIKMLATNIGFSRVLENWVDGVAATGIFVKNIAASWTTTGASGVPTGWTVIYYDTTEDKYYLDQQKSQECDDHGNPLTRNYANEPFTIVAKGSGNIDLLGGAYSHHDSVEDMDEMAWLEFQKSTDGGQTWTTVPYSPDDGNSYITLSVAAGDEIMLRCDVASLVDDSDNSGFDYGILNFNSGNVTANFEVQGNIMSLIYGSNFANQTSLRYNSVDFNFQYMFDNVTNLISAENLILPATTLNNQCYQGMFIGCENLQVAPALPATTLADSCYDSMFSNCMSLTTAPELPATNLMSYCYMHMFEYCESLNQITMLATDISATDCLSSWVNNVSSSGTFVKAASMTSLRTGSDGVPTGWTVQNAT